MSFALVLYCVCVVFICFMLGLYEFVGFVFYLSALLFWLVGCLDLLIDCCFVLVCDLMLFDLLCLVFGWLLFDLFVLFAIAGLFVCFVISVIRWVMGLTGFVVESADVCYNFRFNSGVYNFYSFALVIISLSLILLVSFWFVLLLGLFSFDLFVVV